MAMHGGTATSSNKNAKTAASKQSRPKQIAEPESEKLIAAVEQLMWREVGIIRSRKSLEAAMTALSQLTAPEAHTRRGFEARNVLEVARLITRSALARLESRGAHYRTDYPETDDKRFQKHSVVAGEKVRFE